MRVIQRFTIAIHPLDQRFLGGESLSRFTSHESAGQRGDSPESLTGVPVLNHGARHTPVKDATNQDWPAPAQSTKECTQ
jgi:hypothetical protein